MAIDKFPPVERIAAPTITYLPETDASRTVVIEPYHVDLLPEYGYVSREYLISGVAAGESYCTRILLRCPADATKFTGFIVEEPSHLWGGTSIWRHINRWLMRNGHAWLEVDSQAPSALGKIRNVDPERYKDMHFIPGPLCDEFQDNIPFVTDITKESLGEAYDVFKSRWWPATRQSPEIIAAASYALRTGQLGLTATRVVLSGLSQTGGVTRRFITHSGSHLRLPDGALPFEGFIPCQSGGAALPDLPGAKIIELLGESEFPSVRFPCGVSGQQKGTTHRRPDSDSFRVYEIAGMAHRESRYASVLDLKRWSVVKLQGMRPSSFSNSFIYHAVFEAMVRWIDGRSTPPPSATIRTIGSTDDIIRDEHGNAIGGVRTLHTDAPVSRFIAATPKGRPNWYWGSEVPFEPEKLHALYSSVSNYRSIAGKGIANQMESGFLLPEDAETLRRETIELVDF